MKKVFLSLSAIALVAMFAACGGPKADGKRMAEKECECKTLKKEWKADKENAEKEKKYKDCKEEKEALEKELEAKYKDNDSKEDALKYIEGYASVKCED